MPIYIYSSLLLILGSGLLMGYIKTSTSQGVIYSILVLLGFSSGLTFLMFITGQCSADAECAQSAVYTIGVGICSGAAAAQESFSYNIIAKGATSAVVDILEDGVTELGLSLLSDDVIGLLWTTLQWAWF